MSDNIVKHGQLEDIARDLWTKVKERDINSISYDKSSKKIKATNAQTPALELEAELSNLASVDERTKFKKDVSVNDAGTVNNLHIGTPSVDQSDNRILGFRGLTSKAFVDGYVSELIVYAKSTLDIGTQTSWNVWAIKKEERKEQDTVKATFHKNNVAVESITINGRAEKCVRLSIEQEFSEEVYFLVKSQNQQVKTCIPTNTYEPDVVNMSEPPRDTVGQTFSWDTNNTGNTAIMHLVGRESISSLAEKLRKTQANGSNYVLQSETTTTSAADKVVRLDRDGKINSNMLPSIAINEYFPANDFTDAALASLTYQNGDIVVVTKNGKTRRYLCVNKTNGANSINDFVPLNDKDGIVFSVNEQAPGADGNVTVRAEHIKYNTDVNAKTVKQVLDEKISNIVLKNGDSKKLQVTRADNATSDVDLTEAFKANNISYNKPIANTNRATVEEAIDALKDEANRGVKSIKNGTPGPNGDMDVTVNTSDNGIAMTFGTNGTAVNVVTYMTPDEVTEIKNLFR